MKIAGLITGIVLTIMASLSAVVFLMLPSLTNNRVNFEESMFGFIPSVLALLLGLALTALCAVLVFYKRLPQRSAPGRS
jgi:hypothetical protein